MTLVEKITSLTRTALKAKTKVQNNKHYTEREDDPRDIKERHTLRFLQGLLNRIQGSQQLQLGLAISFMTGSFYFIFLNFKQLHKILINYNN